MRQFIGGFVLGNLLCLGGAAWLILEIEAQPIRFPGKSVYDGGDYYHFEGSVYGEGADAPANNLIDVWCYKDRMECEVKTQSEIDGGGNAFVSSVGTDTINVRKWDEREIIADSESLDPAQCNWYEIKADRKTEEISYTRIPQKSPNPGFCKALEPRVLRWRIDNGKAWNENADQTPRERQER